MEETDPRDFAQRTGFPAYATAQELIARGGRVFTSAQSFMHQGIDSKIEQVQWGDVSRGKVYVWKRIVPAQGESRKLFEIHAEMTEDGMRHYSYLGVETEQKEMVA